MFYEEGTMKRKTQYEEIEDILKASPFYFKEITKDGAVFLSKNDIKIYKDTLSIFKNNSFIKRFESGDEKDFLKSLVFDNEFKYYANLHN